MPSWFGKLSYAWCRHGPTGLLWLVAYNDAYHGRALVYRVHRQSLVDRFDQEHGTDTGGTRTTASLDVVDSPVAIYAVQYEPSGAQLVRDHLTNSLARGLGERREVDVNGLVEEALNLAYHGARAQDASFNITLERDFDTAIAPIELAPQEMTRVLLNLFGNGFYATAKRQRDGIGPEFQPKLKVATRDLGDTVEVRVRDNGTGIAPDVRDKLFQPFVTPTGEGTGLGLSIAWDIVTQQHGGTIAVDSRLGEFTEFTIRLPRVYGATIAEAAA